MNLAFCLFKYFPYGGLQRDFWHIKEICQQRGNQVDVYTFSWQGNRQPEDHIFILQAKGWQNHTRCRAFVHALKKPLSEKKYDLVVGFNKMPGLDVYYAADGCIKARTVEKYGAWHRWFPRYKHLLAYEQAIFAPESQTEILSISPKQWDAYVHHYHTPLSRCHFLPPGISRDRIAPKNADEIRKQQRRVFQLTEEQHFLLFIGSGFKTKGLDRILYGLAALPEKLRQQTQLFIIGQDEIKLFEQQAICL